MRQTLGDLVTTAVTVNHPNVTPVDIQASVERMQAMNKEMFIDALRQYGRKKLGVDIDDKGYVVVHSSLLPAGMKLDREVDRAFASHLVDPACVYFIKSPIGELK
jgi:hypothetical protein